jgi:hypothetical protein
MLNAGARVFTMLSAGAGVIASQMVFENQLLDYLVP